MFSINSRMNPEPIPSNMRPDQVNDNYDTYLRKMMKMYEGVEVSESENEGWEKIELYSQEVILPMIQALNEQNNKLKVEKKTISEEFKRLDFVTQSLLKENQEMTQHCNNRTLDLKKIVETISLNYGEEENDLNHRKHLLKEENNIIIKALNDLLKEQGSLEETIIQQQRSRGDLVSRVKEDQVKILQAQARIEEIKNQIEHMQGKKYELMNEYEDAHSTVTKLCTSNMKIREENTEMIAELQQHTSSIENDKPRLKHNNLQLHGNIISFRKQIEDYEETIDKKEKRVTQLEQILSKQKRDIEARQTEIDKVQTQSTQAKDRIARCETLIRESQVRESKLGTEIAEKIKKRDELKKAVEAAEAEANRRVQSQKETVQEKKTSYNNIIKKY